MEGRDVKELDNICRQFETHLQELQQQKEMQYFGGIGEAVFRLGDIHKSYQQACRAFANRFFTEWNQFTGLDRQEEMLDLNKLGNTGTGRTLVTEFLKGGVQTEVPSFTERYFNTIGEENYKSLLYRKYIMMDVFTEVASFLERIGQSVEMLSEKSRDISDMVIQAGSLEMMKDYFYTLFDDCISVRDRIQFLGGPWTTQLKQSEMN